METNELLQAALVTLIQVLLPIALSYIVVFVRAKTKESKAKLTESQLAFAQSLVSQLVFAAEQNGLIGALQKEGAEKKRYVIDMADTELRKHNINLDLDVLDALVESAVIQAFKHPDAVTEPSA